MSSILALTPKERIEAAINLKPVDRVPFLPLITLFPARYKGMTNAEAIRNPVAATRAIVDVFDEVGGWDGMVFSGYRAYLVPPRVSAVAMVPRILQPGRELPENAAPQFAEHEELTFEDYDPIINLGWKGFIERNCQRFLSYPEEKVIAWAERQFNYYINDTKIWEAKGVPCLVGAMTLSPLMFFSLKRTLTKFTLDLHRYPDKVAAALDAIVGDLIDDALYAANHTRLPCILLALERGSAFYYPLKIFERFEFPYIKKMVETFASNGFITILHFDNDWTLNLPYLRELPKAKCICELDGTTDIFKAKETLSGHMCIMGDIPASLSALGTPAEVQAYCAKLIDIVGKGGGYILSSGCELPPDTKFENFKAMVDIVKRHPPPLQ